MKINSSTETIAKSQIDRIIESFPALREFLVLSSRNNINPEIGLSFSQVRIIIHLYQNGPMFVSRLARDLGLAPSSTTEQVSALESLGRVIKAPVESDKRTVLVMLTAEASAIGAKILAQRRQVIKSVLAQMNENERKTFAKGILLFGQMAQEWLTGDSDVRGAVASRKRELERTLGSLG